MGGSLPVVETAVVLEHRIIEEAAVRGHCVASIWCLRLRHSILSSSSGAECLFLRNAVSLHGDGGGLNYTADFERIVFDHTLETTKGISMMFRKKSRGCKG